MELVRNLIRDLVGIIFPGSLLVIFTLWLIFGVSIVFIPLASLNVFSVGENTAGFVVLLIFSYVSGQSLRIKRVSHVERECTKEYRKKCGVEISEEKFNESIERIEGEEEKYYAGKSTRDRLVDVYKQHNSRFGIWEEFPYPYLMKGRRLLLHPESYNEFFEKYDKQGITRSSRFFNFCKSVIYEFSPSLKEEVLRQEALVRLFAGLYYVIKYGKVVSVVMGLLHLAMFVSSHIFRIGFIHYANLQLSYVILIVSVLAFIVFGYLRREILDRLRFMRAKELNLAYDGLYLTCKRYNLEI